MAIQRVYIVRHGETEWALSGRHTGRTDIALTARGENRARALVGRFRDVRFSHVFVSPRLRAQRTCELAGLGGSAVIDPDLAEWDYGDYEGLRSAEIRQVRPDWNMFRDGCPNGDSPSQIAARADRLIRRLREMEGNIALFSHGHFSRVFAARWINLPVFEAEHFLLDTASLGILDYEHQNPDLPVLGLWNEGPDTPARVYSGSEGKVPEAGLEPARPVTDPGF